jgi:hypothetical protein
MVVNDNAGYLDARVAPAFFASRLAPTTARPGNPGQPDEKKP